MSFIAISTEKAHLRVKLLGIIGKYGQRGLDPSISEVGAYKFVAVRQVLLLDRECDEAKNMKQNDMKRVGFHRNASAVSAQ